MTQNINLMTENNNPWIVQAPKKYESLPIGFYMAKFQGVEEIKLQEEVKWRWTWKVDSGEHVGKTASTLTDRKISPTTLPGALISGLLGRAIVVGENVKEAIDACKGKAYMVSVQAGPQGGQPGVRMVSKPPQM